METITPCLPFRPADILLPKSCDWTRWAVVACDQYSSQPEYWERVDTFVGDAPSTLRMILPEAQLQAPQANIEQIQAVMRDYWRSGVFTQVKDSFIYLERTLSGGRIRRGLIGMVDLEAYDYTPGSGAPVRATEGTVEERIPPRARVRRDALLEFPHVLLLMDDPYDTVLGLLADRRETYPRLYDFELMERGGHVCGWQVSGAETETVMERLETLRRSSPLLFAVGDGNHSLATAKTCYEELKASDPARDWSGHPARYALVEVENIHDPAMIFEPIHRVAFDVEPEKLLAALRSAADAESWYEVPYVTGDRRGTVRLDSCLSSLPVGALQKLLDQYLSEHGGSIDYIHGDDVAASLAAQPGTVALLLPPMEKAALFPGILRDGVLPRKTFSMGSAHEKRFYLEGRLIRDDL